MHSVVCPLCGMRRARRSCPALGKSICAVCCGTKRLTEIQCPSTCGYLASAREHPPAVAVRQQQRDIGLVVQLLRDFTQRQSQLFLLIATFLVRYHAPELQPLIDDDVGECADALAATFETAARGVIYEHRPTSLLAERLVAALKPVLTEAGKGVPGSAFERDAAVVLRRVAEGARETRTHEPGNRRALLDLLARVVKPRDSDTDEAATADRAEPSRLILP
jgi:hypothetical protein